MHSTLKKKKNKRLQLEWHQDDDTRQTLYFTVESPSFISSRLPDAVRLKSNEQKPLVSFGLTLTANSLYSQHCRVFARPEIKKDSLYCGSDLDERRTWSMNTFIRWRYEKTIYIVITLPPLIAYKLFPPHTNGLLRFFILALFLIGSCRTIVLY